MSRSKLLKALRALRRSRPEAIGFAARAWTFAFPVEASLAAFGLAPTLRWIEAVRPWRAPREPVSVDEGCELVAGAYQLSPLRGRCLAQSLVQHLLHRQDGVSSRFVVGVRRPKEAAGDASAVGPGAKPEPIEAHAWVEAPVGAPRPSFSPILARESA